MAPVMAKIRSEAEGKASATPRLASRLPPVSASSCGRAQKGGGAWGGAASAPAAAAWRPMLPEPRGHLCSF